MFALADDKGNDIKGKCYEEIKKVFITFLWIIQKLCYVHLILYWGQMFVTNHHLGMKADMKAAALKVSVVNFTTSKIWLLRAQYCRIKQS
jgi:hypothetical protein